MKSIAKILSATAVAATMLSSCGGGVNTNVKINSQNDSISYAFGYILGNEINNTKEQLNQKVQVEMNYDIILAAIKRTIDGDTNQIYSSVQQANMYVGNIIQQREAMKYAENLEKGKKFLEENAKKEGVVSLPNGLQYKILEEGKGIKPEVTDTVVCDYVGTLIDGTEFDSSVKHGSAAEFPVNRVIPGWTELLQLMPEGSKWMMYIPSDLAYGQRDSGIIPPNSTLVFEVTLHKVKKGPKA